MVMLNLQRKKKLDQNKIKEKEENREKKAKFSGNLDGLNSKWRIMR